MSIGVGIAGFGLSGSVFHAPLLDFLSDYEIKAIMTSSSQEKVRRERPEVKVVSHFKELLTVPGVDLVILALPNDLHFPLAKEALLQGKHLVLEKPFVPSSQEGRELIDLAKAQSRVLTVFHNRRFDSDYLTIKQLIETDTLGEVTYFESHFDRFKAEVDSRWKEQDRPGGGILFDLGSHLIDQALCLFGSPKKSGLTFRLSARVLAMMTIFIWSLPTKNCESCCMQVLLHPNHPLGFSSMD